jgi:hypothetical protein
LLRLVCLVLLGYLTEAQRHRGTLGGSRIAFPFQNLRVPSASVRCSGFGRSRRGSPSLSCPAWVSHGGTMAQREFGRLANRISISESPCPQCLCELLAFAKKHRTANGHREKVHREARWRAKFNPADGRRARFGIGRIERCSTRDALLGGGSLERWHLGRAHQIPPRGQGECR